MSKGKVAKTLLLRLEWSYFINSLCVNVRKRYMKCHHGPQETLSGKEEPQHHTECSRIIYIDLKKYKY